MALLLRRGDPNRGWIGHLALDRLRAAGRPVPFMGAPPRTSRVDLVSRISFFAQGPRSLLRGSRIAQARPIGKHEATAGEAATPTSRSE